MDKKNTIKLLGTEKCENIKTLYIKDIKQKYKNKIQNAAKYEYKLKIKIRIL